MYLMQTLLIIFMVLKLTGLISWGLWVVLSPLWIPIILAMIWGVIIVVVVGVSG